MRDDASQCIYVTTQTIRDMTDRGLFHLESIVIPVVSEESVVLIDLHLNDDRVPRRGRSGFPISGFPRLLAEGDTLKRTSEYEFSMPRLHTTNFSKLLIQLRLSQSARKYSTSGSLFVRNEPGVLRQTARQVTATFPTRSAASFQPHRKAVLASNTRRCQAMCRIGSAVAVKPAAGRQGRCKFCRTKKSTGPWHQPMNKTNTFTSSIRNHPLRLEQTAISCRARCQWTGGEANMQSLELCKVLSMKTWREQLN
jgi:hypothetical protein